MANARATVRDEIKAVMDMNVLEATRKSYARYIGKYVQFLRAKHPSLVDASGNVDLAAMGVEHFQEYVTTIRGVLGISSLRGLRSALTSMYKSGGMSMPDGMEDTLTEFYKGLSRLDAQAKESGERDIGGGRDVISFGAYRYMALMLIDRMPWAQAYHTITWNLMCRTSNTAALRLGHLRWDGDALAVYFAKTKKDPSGEREKDPRHVFANPLHPEVCPILALALHVMCTANSADGLLFKGAKNKSVATRFGNYLQDSLLADEGVRSVLVNTYGCTPGKIGAHSLRKGSGTFLTGGSTAGPSIVQIANRAGWNLSANFTTYLKREQAGDRFVGRCAAGLPLDDANFMILPPHFRAGTFDDDQAATVLRTCFPLVFDNVNLRSMLTYLLASVVQHAPWLRENLRSDHPVFSSAVFTQRGVLAGLRNKLFDIFSLAPSAVMTATGVPSHIAQLHSMQAVKQRVESLNANFSSLPSMCAQSVAAMMEERDVAAGNITLDAMRGMFTSMLAELRPAAGDVGAPPPVAAPPASNFAVQNTFQYNERFYRVPEGWKFPSVTLLTGMRLWYAGDSEAGIVPYTKLRGGDVPTRNHQKTLSEWRKAFTTIEQYARDSGAIAADAIIDVDSYTNVYNAFLPRLKELAGKHKSEGNLKVRTVANHLRAAARRVDAAPVGAVERRRRARRARRR